MLKFSRSQREKFLKLGEKYQRVDGSTFTAIYDQSVTEVQGQISLMMKLTCSQGDLNQDDEVIVNGSNYKIAYIADDNSGMVDCYLSASGKGDRRGKYV
ncbi:hypothetical protein [Buttiauxella noackiae]|uniref:hypothetical protein n=1 Tax=Buttiauxella noackiae TaxID=82992 RepID=UPI00054D0186|nr:hypothetical protein [Buttiauxella noackiae]